MLESLYQNDTALVLNETFQSQNTVRWTVYGTPTFSNGRMTVNNVASYIDTNYTFSNKRNFTIRIKWTILTNKTMCVTQWTAFGDTTLFWTYLDGKIYFIVGGGVITSPVSWGTHDIFFVYDWSGVDNTAKAKIYLNWVLQTIPPSGQFPTITPTLWSNSAKIGRIYSLPDEFSDCTFEQVQIWNRSLQYDEIQAIYMNTKYKYWNPNMDLRKWIKGTGTFVEKYQVPARTWNINPNSDFNTPWAYVLFGGWAIYWWQLIGNPATGNAQLNIWLLWGYEYKIKIDVVSYTSGTLLLFAGWSANQSITITWPWTYETGWITNNSSNPSAFINWQNFIGVLDNHIIYERTPALMPAGQKYFENTGIWYISQPSKQVYWTWEFNYYFNENIVVYFIADKIWAVDTFKWYWIQITGWYIRLIRVDIWSHPVLMRTSVTYITRFTTWRIRVTRGISWEFKIYHKTTWDFVLVSVIWGLWTNPVTDNTYILSNFHLLELKALDRVSDIRFYPYII